ncbi:uncharacterized protein V1518DRAFT_65550 [Limtongia smithiae]|uniref:uncharacterized protein n=1 Tax=Limtongia smithiae TaxID=1125753 RepID=UPI0034CD893B
MDAEAIDTAPRRRQQHRHEQQQQQRRRAKAQANFEHVETVPGQLASTTTTSRTPSVSSRSTASTMSTGGGDASELAVTAAPVPIDPAYPRVLSLVDVVPTSFENDYPAPLLSHFPPQSPHGILDDNVFARHGLADILSRRPSFTRRALVDWDRNDLRSLCFVPALPPSWVSSSGKVPVLREDGYAIVVLPYDANDDAIAHILARSDLYIEFAFSEAHKLRLARETIELCIPATTPRAAVTATTTMTTTTTTPTRVLTRAQWRRVLDNYLLALGCDAQARLDFQTAIMYRALRKQEQQLAQRRGNLLKRVLLTRASSSTSPPSATSSFLAKTGGLFQLRAANAQSPFVSSLPTTPALTATSSPHAPLPVHLADSCFSSSSSSTSTVPAALEQFAASTQLVSHAEQKQIWHDVQALLFSRLGLDWEPTELP